MALTSRGRALRWLTKHRGLTEDPPGSNKDRRIDGITAAQERLARGGQYLVGQPWCGTWFANALLAAGLTVKDGVDGRLAGVAYIEEAAQRGAPPFRGWVTVRDRYWYKKVLRGDAVVLFGYGVHVETVRSTSWVYRRLGYIRTEGGNTGPGDSGSQANGGGAFPRKRRINDIRGFAIVDFPD